MVMDDNRKDGKDPAARLEQLRATYLENLPKRIDRLEYLISGIHTNGMAPEDTGQQRSQIKLVYHEAHKLAGAAGAMGLHSVSRAAKLILDNLDTWYDYSTITTSARYQEIQQLLASMRGAQADEPSPEPEPEPPCQISSHIIHIVDDDELTANQMLAWLQEAGFDAQVFLSASIYGDSFEILPRPDLILMDISFGNESSAGTRIIQFLRQKLGVLPPVVFVSIRDDIEARLSAVRTGASRYLAKPVAREDLIELALEFSNPKGAPSFRVLMVDDDETLLEVNQATLEQAGLIVRSVNNPLETLDAARDFEPDVIILDVLMPVASGTEIAAVLRDDRRFDPVPILFLTVDTHPDQKVIGATLGGDDYITKPCDRDYLLATVFSRARRSRRLRELLKSARSQPDQTLN